MTFDYQGYKQMVIKNSRNCGLGSVEAMIPSVGRLTDLRMPDKKRSKKLNFALNQ